MQERGEDGGVEEYTELWEEGYGCGDSEVVV